jgi:aminopeptidase N
MKRFFFSLFIVVSLNLQSQTLPEEIWTESVKSLQEGNLIFGLELTNKYLELSPNSKYAFYNKGVALYQLGDMRGSCENFNRAFELGFTKNEKSIDYYCNKEYKLKTLKEFYYKDELLTAENGYRPQYTKKDTLRGLLRPERSCFDVTFYNLSVRILINSKSIVGNNEIYFRVLEPTKRIQLDLAENMIIDSIVRYKQKLLYSREYDAVWIDFPEELKKQSSEKITVYYKGKPRFAPNPPWDGGFVWKKSGIFTQFVGVACEQLGASVWWPTKDHLTDRPDSMGINIEVPDKYQAVCNGTLRKVTKAGNKYSRFEWFVQYPINNYNATFYMGKYVEFTDTLLTLGDTLICRYHVLPKNLEIAKKHFKQAHEVIDFYNRTYGPFPFWKDNFRMVESPYEGMEHQTAIAYGDAYDTDKNVISFQNKNYDYIIVHEAAHEWWGNSTTVGDMTDAWIHEGFATYSEYLFLEEKLGYTESLKELQKRMLSVFNFWPMVQNRNVNENAFASGDIYVKGAAMLQSLRSTVNNDSLFMAMIHGFYTEYKNSIVETTDFIEYANYFLCENYTPFFEKFLYDTDLPILNYTYERKPEGILFTYQWNEVPENFQMAFGIESIPGNGIRLVGTTHKQEILLEQATTFNFYNLSKDLSNAPHNSFTYYWTKGETPSP